MDVFDAGVRNAWRDSRELLEHLPDRWRARLADGAPGLSVRLRARMRDFGDAAFVDARSLVDAVLPSESSRAILVLGDEVRAVALQADPHLSAELATAVNRWTAERWLAADPRLRGSIHVSTQLPDAAAEEVRRAAADPRFVQVLMTGNALSKPFGHPLYHPIYAAAVEHGLPVCIAAPASGGIAPSPVGGGFPTFRFEEEALVSESAMMHLVNLITHGAFERFPDLRIVFSEVGLAWMAPLLWRFDADYKALHREVPWVRELPSEYARRHVRVTTASLDAPTALSLSALVELTGGPEAVMFASGAPRWDTVSAETLAASLPDDWRAAILRENAAGLFREPTTAAVEGARA